MSSNLRAVSELPYILHGHGVKHAIVSPGSRNAPLILSLVNHSGIKIISIADERSAGYYALGISQQLQKPVALFCTSGTAFVNYGPALTEAAYMGLPLIAISADRPPEWIDQNDGQAIRQPGFFPNILKKSFSLPESTDRKEDLDYFRRLVNEAMNLSVSGLPGPVHLNFPLREPLYNSLPEVAGEPTIIATQNHFKDLSNQEWELLRKKWTRFGKKLIVCGFLHQKNSDLQELLGQLIDNEDVVVIAENLSNLFHPDFIHNPECFTAALDEEKSKEFQPDLLITMGKSIVSKRLKKYLRTYSPKEHWHVDENENFIDTFNALNLNIPLNPERFFKRIQEVQSQKKRAYNQFTAEIRRRVSEKQREFLNNTEFSDLKVFEAIFRHLPTASNLHLANSTPVRYAQLFETRPDLSYFSNRGTSGIDGCISTAAGSAMATTNLNVLLVGDIAFIYDSNGFWNNRLPSNLRVVVIDNGGGNIFRLIETGPEAKKILPFIETPHDINIENLSRAYGLNFLKAANTQDLEDLLPLFFEPEAGPTVLFIRTDGRVSARVFKEYFQKIIN